MTTSFYLEHYLDSLESLPGELRRNFTLMHDMDDKNRNILRDVDAASDDYLRKVQDLNSDARKIEMEKIHGLFKKAKEYGDEKVSIAVQSYEIVDRYIRRLDGDLTKFEAEMREKGRISLAEAEEDGIDDENGLDDNGNNTAYSGVRRRKHKSGQTPTTGSNTKKKGQKNRQGNKNNLTGHENSTAITEEATSICQNEFGLEVIDMPILPNEPTYCSCQQVSHGEMVGCDNPECLIEWFHFGCVKLITKPKGNWYCPECLPLFDNDENPLNTTV